MNLTENWNATKEALVDGLEGNKKTVMEQTLENTKQYLAETAAAGTTMAGNIATLNKVILPVIRRVMPTVIEASLTSAHQTTVSPTFLPRLDLWITTLSMEIVLPLYYQNTKT